VENGGRKWGDKMFLGTFEHNMDDKNRLIIPAKYREELGNTFYITRGLENCLFLYSTFYITRGLENCLFLYSEKEWNQLVEKLNTLTFTKKDARNFMRFFYSGATTLELDKQGRISIPSYLVEYANITHTCKIIGVGERLEIWAEETWNDFYFKEESSLSESAEHLFEEGMRE